MPPTPFEEVNDERRTVLVNKLAKLMIEGALSDPGFWAFIWLSDIEKLEEFYNLLAPLNRSFLSCQYRSSGWGRVLKMCEFESIALVFACSNSISCTGNCPGSCIAVARRGGIRDRNLRASDYDLDYEERE